jgi:hypothetical protein
MIASDFQEKSVFRTHQYLRQASLTFNSQFEMLMRNS